MASDGSTIKEQTVVYKLATETVNNSVVLQDDNELKVNLALGEKVLFELRLFSWMNTGGIKLAMNGPACSAIEYSGIGMDATTPFSTTFAVAWDSIVCFRAAAGAVNCGMIMWGSCVTTAAGVLVLRWAQQAAVANDTTIYLGSWMRVIRM